MRIFLSVMLAIWGVATPVLAQEKVSAAITAVAPSTTIDAASSVDAAPEPVAVMDLKMSQEGNVSLDFRDAEIRNVLKVLAYKSGVNIIAGPEVVGLVNIQLKDVPWQKAMEVILSTYGYGYEQKGTVIMVTTMENLKKRREDAKSLAEQEPLSSKTFLLNFAKAEDVVRTIDKMKTSRGSINFDQRTNTVIISDVESNLATLTEVVKRLDAITPQVLIEARIIETTLSNQEKLGLQWPTGVTTSQTFAPRTNFFPWGLNSSQYAPDGVWSAPTDPAIAYGTLTIGQLSLALDMLKSRTNTNILSNPRIVTLDNQPAKILVGSKYPLPKYTYSDAYDKLIISGWEYIEYGLTFNVTPHINGRGMVTLDLEPTITDSPSSVKFGVGTSATSTTDIPVLSTESAKTNVMIRDGETLVIAGLIKDKKIVINDRVPILGDIPFFGVPFRHKNETIVKTELVIFLTPHIITADMTVPAEKPLAVK